MVKILTIKLCCYILIISTIMKIKNAAEGLNMLLKNIENFIEKKDAKEKDLMSDTRYICKSCALITESLQKGCDVLQLANGDIIVTELKAVTFQYTWDEKRGKLVRSQFSQKSKKAKSRKNEGFESQIKEDFESVEEFA